MRTGGATSSEALIGRAEMTLDFDGLIRLILQYLYNEKKIFIRELTSDTRDATQQLHSARGELRRRHSDRSDIYPRFKVGFLFLDYVLACLRFAAVLPSCGETYSGQSHERAGVRKADKPSSSVTTLNLATRPRKTCTTAGWVMSYARAALGAPTSIGPGAQHSTSG